MFKILNTKLNRDYLILGGIFFLIFIFRFPSLFEPFWYGDEGIFAAVARNLNLGGTLYQTAWDNKPPLIYLTYAGIFKLFGVSMFWLRMVTSVVVLLTAAIIYEVAKVILGPRRALLASAVFGVLVSLRIVEGNLALTEIFMILPISFAIFFAILRKFDYFSVFLAGFLFAFASLYKQVGALEAGALGIFVLFYEKSFVQVIKKAFFMALGFVTPFTLAVAYFAPKNLLADYIFAAYTYYRIYLGESPKYAVFINVLKIMPILAAIAYGIYKKIKGQISLFHLILLWAAFSFLGSYFSGRTYGHYLVQAVPAFSLLVASIAPKVTIKKIRVAFAVFFFVPLIFLTKLLFTDFLSGGPLNQLSWWGNFLDFAQGKKGTDAYNNYFDGNVNTIMALSNFLKQNGGFGENVYIWGDYPWLYAIADLKNPVRYVTSFHVFGVPGGREEVMAAVSENPPLFIIKPQSSIGYFAELEDFIANRYALVSKVDNSQVFEKVY